jgi:hypothetical protein
LAVLPLILMVEGGIDSKTLQDFTAEDVKDNESKLPARRAAP